ncbi:hypothetical protein GCM10010286_08090 [Streptomyces toxytricini]|nr:hypothetical protein GCM10010286_08090 [Streptomyces toxytricini]
MGGGEPSQYRYMGILCSAAVGRNGRGARQMGHVRAPSAQRPTAVRGQEARQMATCATCAQRPSAVNGGADAWDRYVVAVCSAA